MKTALEVATTKAPSLIDVMASDRSISPQNFLNAIKSTVFPKDGTNEQLMAFLMVANKYKLDPLLKEIYAFPTKGGGIMPIVGIDGWTSLVNSNPNFDGVQFVEMFDEKGKISAITCKIYRKDRAHPTEITEYLSECKRGTEPWNQWPIRMLRHKSFIQCARLAFSISGVVDEDEAERAESVHRPAEVTVIEGNTRTETVKNVIRSRKAQAQPAENHAEQVSAAAQEQAEAQPKQDVQPEVQAQPQQEAQASAELW